MCVCFARVNVCSFGARVLVQEGDSLMADCIPQRIAHYQSLVMRMTLLHADRSDFLVICTMRL